MFCTQTCWPLSNLQYCMLLRSVCRWLIWRPISHTVWCSENARCCIPLRYNEAVELDTAGLLVILVYLCDDSLPVGQSLLSVLSLHFVLVSVCCLGLDCRGISLMRTHPDSQRRNSHYVPLTFPCLILVFRPSISLPKKKPKREKRKEPFFGKVLKVFTRNNFRAQMKPSHFRPRGKKWTVCPLGKYVQAGLGRQPAIRGLGGDPFWLIFGWRSNQIKIFNIQLDLFLFEARVFSPTLPECFRTPKAKRLQAYPTLAAGYLQFRRLDKCLTNAEMRKVQFKDNI